MQRESEGELVARGDPAREAPRLQGDPKDSPDQSRNSHAVSSADRAEGPPGAAPGRKLNRPITARPVNRPLAEEARKRRWRSRERSIMGVRVRCSTNTNAVVRTTNAVSRRPTEGPTSRPGQRERGHQGDQRQAEGEGAGQVGTTASGGPGLGEGPGAPAGRPGARRRPGRRTRSASSGSGRSRRPAAGPGLCRR